MGPGSTTTIRLRRWIWRIMVLSPPFFLPHFSARRSDWLWQTPSTSWLSVRRVPISSTPLFPLSTSSSLLPVSLPLTFGPTFLQRWADLGGSDASDFFPPSIVECHHPPRPSLTLVHILLWALLIILFSLPSPMQSLSLLLILSSVLQMYPSLSLRLSLDQLDHFGLLRESALVCTVMGRVGHEVAPCRTLGAMDFPGPPSILQRGAPLGPLFLELII
jgi:hypothetical protein